MSVCREVGVLPERFPVDRSPFLSPSVRRSRLFSKVFWGFSLFVFFLVLGGSVVVVGTR